MISALSSTFSFTFTRLRFHTTIFVPSERLVLSGVLYEEVCQPILTTFRDSFLVTNITFNRSGFHTFLLRNSSSSSITLCPVLHSTGLLLVFPSQLLLVISLPVGHEWHCFPPLKEKTLLHNNPLQPSLPLQLYQQT